MNNSEASPEDLHRASADMAENEIDESQLQALLSGESPAIVIDLRGAPVDDERTIDGAVIIPLEDLVAEKLEQQIPDKSSTIILICSQSFQPTRMVALTTYAYPTLKLLGYTDVKILRDWG